MEVVQHSPYVPFHSYDYRIVLGHIRRYNRPYDDRNADVQHIDDINCIDRVRGERGPRCYRLIICLNLFPNHFDDRLKFSTIKI